jgi:outer membrane receptor protein involved in Fe transport
MLFTVLATGYAPMAMAQSSEADAGNEAQADEKEAADKSTIDRDIIVNARRIREKLADAPISGTAIGTVELETLVIDKFDDLARQLPSVTIVNTGPDYLSDVSIRGQGNGRSGFNESSTGIYRNGVYVAGGGFGGRTYNRLDLFDIERFEAFRGPQAALFGRNAAGGAINVVSQRPEIGELSGFGKVGYDDRERYEVEGAVNLPIGDNIAARVGGIYMDQNDGFYRSQATGEFVDRESFHGIRGSLKGEFGENWSLTITGEYSKANQPAFTSLGRRTDFLGRNERFDPDQFTRVASDFGRTTIKDRTAFANLEGDVGFANFAMVGTWRKRDGLAANEDQDHFTGWDGIGGARAVQNQDENFERYGIEATLSSKDDPNSPIRWLVGADYQSYDDRVITSATATRTGLAAGRFPPPAFTAAENQLNNQFNGFLVQNNRTDTSREQLDGWSIFGLVGYKLTDKLEFTYEGRYQRDSKDFSIQRATFGIPAIAATAGPPATPAIPAIAAGTPIAPQSNTFVQSVFSGVFSAKYSFNPNHNIYARIANGYRPGGFNIGGANLNTIPYQPERVLTAEAGWKGKLGQLRASVSGFYTRTKDLQQNAIVDLLNNTNTLTNVKGGEFYGFEAEASTIFKMGSDRLSLRWSFSTNYGEYEEGTSLASTIIGGGNNGNLANCVPGSIVPGPNNSTVCNLAIGGNRSPRNRDYAISILAKWTHPINDKLDLSLSANGSFEGGGFENPQGSLQDPGINSRKLQPVERVDLRAELDFEKFRISGFIQNVFNDTVVLTSIQGNEYYTNPRVTGVEIGFRF